MKTQLHSTTRFSNRVENYARYRPHYPAEVLDFFTSELALKKDSVIADIGSGTGISSELFLQNGNTVYCIEPNKEMREAAEKIFRSFRNFISIEGTAESTNLKSDSIEFVIVGQAFHWFHLEKSKTEFKRILRSSGYVVLLWNERKIDSSAFMRDYEILLNKFGTDYKEVRQINVDERVLDEFYGRKNYRSKVFSNFQEFNFTALKGRLLSSSYAPTEGHPDYEPMIEMLNTIFEKHQQNGSVRFEYETKLYYGHLN